MLPPDGEDMLRLAASVKTDVTHDTVKIRLWNDWGKVNSHNTSSSPERIHPNEHTEIQIRK